MSRRVLVVDDSLTVRMDLCDVFESEGFEVVLSGSLTEARGALREHSVDLVVLDVILPDGDGLDLLAELRESEETSELTVLLLSTEVEVADRLRGMARGADDYVGKPYDASHVLTRARQLLEVPVDSSRPLILVIDDSATYRNQLTEALEEAGYRTATASDGEEGLRRAAQDAPAIVIVDGIMPGMDGPEVIRRLRLDPGLRATPCLLLTASSQAASEVEALSAGADAFVRKDQDLRNVLARLHALFRSASETTRWGPGRSLLEPERVLAVDDSATYLAILSDRLRDDGYAVVAARTGEEAIALVEAQPVDAILMDLVMPGLSGMEACRRIKASKSLRSIPLILMTAHDGPEAMLEGIDAGADDYVAKSSDLEVLVARLRAQLRRQRFEDEHRRINAELVRQEAETRAATELAETRRELSEKLASKNALLESNAAELAVLNAELEGFAYSVSHDLRQPLRSLDGFSRVLLERYSDGLDDKGKHYLDRIRDSAQRMAVMIDGLLTLSRVTRAPLRRVELELDKVARRIIDDLREADSERSVQVGIQPGMTAFADPGLVESLLENLLGNAWKFTARNPKARIELATEELDGEVVHVVRDNGAGFDMTYADKLFGPFQRLHSAKEFEGTGIGLATVQRIVLRHGGRVWAESAADEGATFRFTLAPPGQGDVPDES